MDSKKNRTFLGRRGLTGHTLSNHGRRPLSSWTPSTPSRLGHIECTLDWRDLGLIGRVVGNGIEGDGVLVRQYMNGAWSE